MPGTHFGHDREPDDHLTLRLDHMRAQPWTGVPGAIAMLQIRPIARKSIALPSNAD
jgi:hypothetical protein